MVTPVIRRGGSSSSSAKTQRHPSASSDSGTYSIGKKFGIVILWIIVLDWCCMVLWRPKSVLQRLIPSVVSRFQQASFSQTATPPIATMKLDWLSTPQMSVGLGTMDLTKEQAPQIISQAILDLGYRRIDCAPVYMNEDAVGDGIHAALQTKQVQRNDLFVVSKLASPFHKPEHVQLALQKTLQDLRVDYLDLYLIHWPAAFDYVDISNEMNHRGYSTDEIDDSDNGKRIGTTVSIHDTWKAMENLVHLGLVKHIGVSNFPVSLLHELLTKSTIPPVVNQCEGHPYLPQSNLLRYCQARGVHYQAYSPLGTPGYKQATEPSLLEEPLLLEIAQSLSVTPAQVALAWALQRGTSVVVKSATPLHLKANWEAARLTLSEGDMKRIESTLSSRNLRFFRPEDWWGDMAMAVFD